MLRQDTRTAARRLCNCLPPGVRQCLIIAIVVPGCMAFKGPACGSQHMSGFTAHSSDKLSWDTIPVFIFSAPRLRACLLWPVPPHVLRAQPWLMHVMQAADQQSLNRSCDSSMSDPTPRDDPRRPETDESTAVERGEFDECEAQRRQRAAQGAHTIRWATAASAYRTYVEVPLLPESCVSTCGRAGGAAGGAASGRAASEAAKCVVRASASRWLGDA